MPQLVQDHAPRRAPFITCNVIEPATSAENLPRTARLRLPHRVAAGQAVATTAGNLNAQWVIHTVGPPPLDAATVQAAVKEADPDDRPAMLRRLTQGMIRDEKREIELTSLVSQEVSRTVGRMRDPEMFPLTIHKAQSPSAKPQRPSSAVAQIAAQYWPAIEPFCWSLQAAARWALKAETLGPWTAGFAAFWNEVFKSPTFGPYDPELFNLRRIPSLITTFVAALYVPVRLADWRISKLWSSTQRFASRFTESNFHSLR